MDVWMSVVCLGGLFVHQMSFSKIEPFFLQNRTFFSTDNFFLQNRNFLSPKKNLMRFLFVLKFFQRFSDQQQRFLDLKFFDFRPNNNIAYPLTFRIRLMANPIRIHDCNSIEFQVYLFLFNNLLCNKESIITLANY
jgi:hypothetical protein